MGTTPTVFIIESVTLENEANGRTEGRILQDILRMVGRDSQYYYIRTHKELTELMIRFTHSKSRYLHLSCHGNKSSLDTTFDTIPVKELAGLLGPHLDKRRLFLSACYLANSGLAEALIPTSGCYSIAGPSPKIHFADAALLWASFYRLMFRSDIKTMTRDQLHLHLQSTASLFGVGVNLYYRTKQAGVAYDRIKPVAV